MLFISEEQVQQGMTMPKALPILRKAFEDCSNELIFYPQRVTLPVRGDENSCIWLPACNKHIPFFGVKYASSFPGNVKKGIPTVISQISLYSADTGELLGIVSANYLTAIKTGGAAGVATDVMSRKDAKRVGIIGTGVQALTQVMAIQEVREIEELRVFDLDSKKVDSFIEKVESIKNRDYKIIKASSGDDCVENSEIISTCTPSTKPVFSAKSLKPGSHLNAIGSFTPVMQEVDEETVLKANKIVTEHVDEMWNVAGDILIPFNAGKITKEKINGSVGDVLTGKIKGRENDTEITMYESIGSGVLDISVAIEVYNQFK